MSQDWICQLTSSWFKKMVVQVLAGCGFSVVIIYG